jgi:hypothetical protein
MTYNTHVRLLSTVARIISDVLTRNRDKPDFRMSLLTCSITYMQVLSFSPC